MGFPFRRFFTALEVYGPQVLQLTPLAPITPYVQASIALAEALPGASGQVKKALVVELVKQGVQAANVEKPGSIDEAAAATATGASIDAIVAATNLHLKGV